MRTRSIALLSLLLTPILAPAQDNPFLMGGFGGFGQRQEGSGQPWKEFKLDPNKKLNLSFRNANVDLVVALFSRESGINIVKDPNLSGPITVTSAGAVSLETAFEILSVTLSLKGYELRKEGNLLVIRQRGGRGRDDGPRNPFEGINIGELSQQFRESRGELKVYPLTYANATQISRVINEVFATVTDPTMDILNMLMGSGAIPGMPAGMGNFQFGNFNNQGARGGNQGGRGNQGNPFNRGAMNFARGGNFGRPGSVVRASADDFSNSVIVNAPASEHRQVESLIRQIDKESEAPLQPVVYRLDYAWCEDVAPAIQNVLVANAPTGRGGTAQQNVPFEQRIQQAMRFGNARSAFGQVVTDARTNSLIVSATEDNHKVVARVIKELDTEVTMEANAFVLPLNNARADEVATLLGQAFGQRNTNANRNTRNQVGGRTTTGTQNQRNNQGNMGGTQPRTGGGGGGGLRIGGEEQANEQALYLELEDPEASYGELLTSINVAQGFGIVQGGFGGQQQRTAAAGTQGRDPQGRIVNTRDLTNQVTIIPDQNTNSLIVVTSPDNVELLRQILEQLDRIPEQVMIETLIIEATLDSSSKFGLEWKYTQTNAFGKDGSTGTAEGLFGLQTTTPPLQGFRYTLTGGSLEGFFNMLQRDEKFQVLSTPRIFTSNNAQAQINISQRVPYVLSTREDPNGNLTFTYAFQDVGIVLTVTPRITSNGYVTMDIVQTANDLQGFTDFNAPIINQRQADTTVSVRDGETVILGGIIRNTVSSTVRKVPLLGDIPILGNIFRSTDKSNVKTELLVFLTPRVVRSPEDAQKLRKEQEEKMSKASQEALKKTIPPTVPPTGGGDRTGGGR